MIKKWILPVIVIAQFSCTSLWFAGNAVMKELVNNFHLSENTPGHLTSAVQFGFITGTLCYALLMIADKFSPSLVFFCSALAGAVANLAMIIDGQTFITLFTLRFLTGFFLAGIYPVGMKIASDYYDKKLGKALGFLVGALVIGTAFPHLVKSMTQTLPWKFVIILTSSLCVAGALLLYITVPDGPYRKKGERLNVRVLFKVFDNKNFRSASFGYFGHMWELYTFWAFVPVILSTYQGIYPGIHLNIPALSFIIIALGGVACVIGGYLSERFGAKWVAATALLFSGICCLISPLMFLIPSEFVFISFLIFWGMVVIADSPLFSSLVARNAPLESKGSALTIVTCIGFSITIISIQLLTWIIHMMDPKLIYLVLTIGPALGLIALLKKDQRTSLTKNEFQ